MVATLLPPRRFRRNYTLLGADISLFSLSLSFASLYGLLPLFVSHLSTSTIAIGMLPLLQAVGMIPPLFIASIVERQQQKKPFVLWVTIFERLPYLALAIATPLLAIQQPTGLLWLVYLMLGITIFGGGLAMPAWLDLIAKVIPESWRGRFFGHATAVGGLLGIAGSALAAVLLQHFDWVNGVALCFAFAFLAMVVSFLCLLAAKEPATEAAIAHPDTDWRRLPAILRQDRNLRYYILALILITAARPTTTYYVVDARATLGLSDGTASFYVTVLTAASTVGYLLWGYVGDHLGHKWVVVGGAISLGLAALVALVVRTPAAGIWGYGCVFLLSGLAVSALLIAALTVIVALAPQDQRPTYIGLANAAQAPPALIAPLLGAYLAEHFGYPLLFLLTAILALVGSVILTSAVHPPTAELLSTTGD